MNSITPLLGTNEAINSQILNIFMGMRESEHEKFSKLVAAHTNELNNATTVEYANGTLIIDGKPVSNQSNNVLPIRVNTILYVEAKDSRKQVGYEVEALEPITFKRINVERDTVVNKPNGTVEYDKYEKFTINRYELTAIIDDYRNTHNLGNHYGDELRDMMSDMTNTPAKNPTIYVSIGQGDDILKVERKSSGSRLDLSELGKNKGFNSVFDVVSAINVCDEEGYIKSEYEGFKENGFEAYANYDVPLNFGDAVSHSKTISIKDTTTGKRFKAALVALNDLPDFITDDMKSRMGIKPMSDVGWEFNGKQVYADSYNLWVEVEKGTVNVLFLKNPEAEKYTITDRKGNVMRLGDFINREITDEVRKKSGINLIRE